MLVIGKASQRQCPLPSTLQGIFSVPCTLPFCLCLLKKVKPRYTNTHTNHPEKKKKSSRSRQTSTRVQAQLCPEGRAAQAGTLRLAVTQTEVSRPPQASSSWTQRSPEGLHQCRMGNCVKSPLRNLSRKVCLEPPSP